MKRKTIEIEKLLQEANKLLAIIETEDNKQWINQEMKSGICTLLEYALHESGNYHGFNYNEWMNRGGCEAWNKENDKANGEQQSIDPELYPKHYSLVDTSPYLGKEYDRFYY